MLKGESTGHPWEIKIKIFNYSEMRRGENCKPAPAMRKY